MINRDIIQRAMTDDDRRRNRIEDTMRTVMNVITIAALLAMFFLAMCMGIDRHNDSEAIQNKQWRTEQ